MALPHRLVRYSELVAHGPASSISMLVLLPAIALLALLSALVSRGMDWRRAVVQTLLAGGLWVWMLTEGLSLIGWLGKPALAVGWAIVLVVAALAIDREALPQRLHLQQRPRSDRALLFVTGAVIAFSVGAAFLSAVLGSPNAIDVLQYHLPRVIFWLQNGSVEFFPANYYQQLSLQPMAEYAMAHVFALTGGDRFVQLIPWAAFVGSICGLAWLASLLGAGFRGQVLAAGLAAAAPNAMLQASGAKNDLVQAFFLIAAAGFAFEAARSFRRTDAAWAGAAAGLALLTKGTAYVFAPGLAVGVLLAVFTEGRRALLRHAAVIVLIALALNSPHYARNYAYNGHPLGDGTATETADAGYANERSGPGVVLSNVLRNAVLQFAEIPGFAEDLYARVWTVHQWFGLDPNDRATTFGSTMFEPAEWELLETHDETLAPSLLHTLLLAPLVIWLLWRRRLDPVAGFSIGVFLAFLLFCALIKWQPWHVRMHTPLQLLACAPIGMMLARIRNPLALIPLAAAALYLLIPAALYNGNRPLLGPQNVFSADRYEQYFVSLDDDPTKYLLAADFVRRSGCRRVGVDAGRNFNQYPVLVALLDAVPAVRLQPSGVQHASQVLRPPGWSDDMCAVLCLRCGDEDWARQEYGAIGAPARFSDLAVFHRNTNAPKPSSDDFDYWWVIDRNGDFTFEWSTELRGWDLNGDTPSPLAGDWNGDGSDDLGAVDLESMTWYRNSDADAAVSSREIHGWGSPGNTPVLGDWNGDGRTSMGAFSDGAWAIDWAGNAAFTPATDQRGWGPPGSIPVVGDWDGDGDDDLGAVDPKTMTWFLDRNGDFRLDLPAEQIGWGSPGWFPVVGDWDGDGDDDIGAIDLEKMTWFRDLNGNFVFDEATEIHTWGRRGNRPVVGDWDGDGEDDMGAVDLTTMTWFLDLNAGVDAKPFTAIRVWGSPGDRPVVGDWNGDGKDKIGVFAAGRKELETDEATEQ